MRPHRGLAAVAAVFVLGTTSGCAQQGPTPATQSSEATASAPVQTADPPSDASPVAPSRRAPSVRAAEAPRRALLPSGRSVAIRAVGTTDAGVLDVPDDISIAGWWRGGSRLGDPFGSVLVAAHVDSTTQGLGPFAELLSLQPGTRIRLESRSLRQTYEVQARRLVPQGSLADDSWIFDVSGRARLTMVTCAPPYDARRGGYQNLAVVTALPVDPR